MRDRRFDADVRVALAPSTFRGQTIDHGETRLTLAGGTASLTGVLTSPAGASRSTVERSRSALRRRVLCCAAPASRDVDLAAWSSVAGVEITPLGDAPRARGIPRRRTPARPGRSRRLISIRRGSGTRTWTAARRARRPRAARRGSPRRCGCCTTRWPCAADVTYGDGTRADMPTSRSRCACSRRWRVANRCPRAAPLVARTTFEGLTPATAVIEAACHGGGAIDRARLDSLLATVRPAARNAHDRHAVGAIGDRRRHRIRPHRAVRHQRYWRPANSTCVDVRDAAPLRALAACGHARDRRRHRWDVRITGPTTARRVEVTGALRSLAWNQNRVLGADGTITAVLDRGWRPISGRARARLRRFQGRASPLQEAQARVTLERRGRPTSTSTPRSTTSTAHVAGRSTEDSLGSTSRSRRSTSRPPTWRGRWPIRRGSTSPAAGTRSTTSCCNRSSGRHRANGHIDRRGEQDLAVDLQGVGVDVLSAWVGRPGVSGTLDGMLALTGPAAAPKGHGSVRLALLRQRSRRLTLRQPTGVGRHAARSGRQLLDAQVGLAGVEGATSRSRCHSKRPTRAEPRSRGACSRASVDVRVTADRFPLQALSPLAGTTRGRLAAGDARRGCEPQGLEPGARRQRAGRRRERRRAAPGLGVTYSNIEVHGEFQGNRLDAAAGRDGVRQGLASTGPGEISLRQRDAHRAQAPRDGAEVRVRAHDRPARDRHRRGRRHGNAHAAPVERKGKTTVRDSYYYVTQTDLAAAQPDRRCDCRDADVRMMERRSAT